MVEASTKLSFTVRFNSDSTVAEAYAIDRKGQIWGRPFKTKAVIATGTQPAQVAAGLEMVAVRMAPLTPAAYVTIGRLIYPFYVSKDPETGTPVFFTVSGDEPYQMKGDAATVDHIGALRAQYGAAAVHTKHELSVAVTCPQQTSRATAPKSWCDKSREEILTAFGYVITEDQAGFGATIAEDSEAFKIVGCASRAQAVDEAYAFLRAEVDPELHDLP